MTKNSQTKDQSEELENKANTEETEASNAADVENPESEQEENSADTEDANDDPLTKLQAEYDNLNNKYLRLYSEFENFRRRTAKERLENITKAGADVIEEILPIVDDFDRAIKSNENSEDPEALKEGFTLIHNKLLRILEAQGLKPMDSTDSLIKEEFNKLYHRKFQSRIDFMLEILKNYSLKTATDKNRSFSYFYHRYLNNN